MQNPFRSEAEAFRFLIRTIAYFAVIAVAALINKWLGVAILVIANETVGGAMLRDRIRERSEGVRAEVLVVAPALNTPIRHWASDEDGARAVAETRLEESLERLRAGGVNARGEVG